MNKEIPNNIEAEQSVLGSMLLSKYALDKAIETLTIFSSNNLRKTSNDFNSYIIIL